jgi:YD repeat-containing protein
VIEPGGNTHTYKYSKAGVLQSVLLNGDTHLQNIIHNAKGHREHVYYSNGTKTKYVYDPKTNRLTQLLTTGQTGTVVYQDLKYFYDAVSNITTIKDDAQQTLFFNNAMVQPVQKFTYDALYRLITAEGRELISLATFGMMQHL